MRITHTKTTIILIAGAVFTAGLMIGFGGYVFAHNNWNSSRSNTSTGIMNRDVGNLLIDYGYGGEVVNQVTEALARGVTTDGLRAILGGTSARSPAVVEEVLQKLEVELERLGIREDDTQAISAPDATGAVPSASDGTIKDILPRPPTSLIENLKAAKSKEQSEDIRKELQANRQTLQKSAEALRQNLRENAKELRDNFRENATEEIEIAVEIIHRGRIALAHGKGLRMVNRYRSAIARFDHILNRLESRIEKIENEAQARAKGKVKWTNPPSVILLIEEAKNMQVENKAKLAELEAKYESLLLGENPGGVAKEARAIAKELKAEIEKLHAKLRKIADDIKLATKNFNSSKSNTSI